MYNSGAVKAAGVRKWPGNFVTAVKAKTCEIRCIVFNNEGDQLHDYSVDELKEASLKDLANLTTNEVDLWQLVLQCALVSDPSMGTTDQKGKSQVEADAVKEVKSFKPVGFRQHGWLPEVSDTGISIQIFNEATEPVSYTHLTLPTICSV